MPPQSLCMSGGCVAAGVHTCAYIDRDGLHCDTHWCAAHVRLFGGTPFCRRHASTMAALSSLRTADGSSAPHPPLPNRGASLVRWMARELDTPLRQLLHEHLAGEDDHVTTVGRTELPDEVHETWTWLWGIVRADGGAPIDISISVDEMRDDEVRVAVNGDVVFTGVPPWVAHNRAGVRVDPSIDYRERQEEMHDILRAIRVALGVRRTR